MSFEEIHRREHEDAEFAQSNAEKLLRMEKMRQDWLNRIGAVILDACITVHRELGPGLLESAYVLALLKELELRGLKVLIKQPIEMHYKGMPLGKIYIMDMLVEDEIILEIKSVETMDSIFTSQLITYLKLAGKNLGYLINFNVPLMKQGFKRIVYNF